MSTSTASTPAERNQHRRRYRSANWRPSYDKREPSAEPSRASHTKSESNNRHRQRELSDRIHAAGDAAARQHGWAITKSSGALGFGARSYRDPRFNSRRQQRSLSEQGAAMSAVRQRQHRPARPMPASSPDGRTRADRLEQADGTSGETRD